MSRTKNLAWRRLVPALLLASLPTAAPAQAPVLGLDEAFRRADAAAYSNRIAEGQAGAAAAKPLAALRGILPTVRAEAGWTRTDDPLNAFGFRLRQREVSMEAFAPDSLNDPEPRSHVSTGLVLELPIFNGDAWMGRQAAASAARAARASAAWTRESVRLDVVRAYFGGVMATEKVVALEAALASAREHVKQAEAMETNGVVTRADVLLASVKAGEVEAQLLQARGDAELATRQLAALLGSPGETAIQLPAALPGADAVRAELGRTPEADGARADLEAARQGVDAADRNRSRARSLYLPRLNSMARMDWNSPDAPFDREASWTVGVMATWTPFAGGAQLAEVRQADAEARTAAAMADAAEAGARIEAARAETDVGVAREQLSIAERSVAQAEEAHRIVSRKYEGGLATVVEVLDAAAAETGARLGFAAIRYQAIVAEAGRRLAQGRDLTTLAAIGR